MKKRINNSILGGRLAEARKNAGLTRQELCDRLNNSCLAPQDQIIREDTYKQWEYGNNKINVLWIPALCATLNCDAGYLFLEYSEYHRSSADICKEIGLSEAAADTLSKKRLSSKELREAYRCRGLNINDYYDEEDLLSTEEIEQQPNFGSWDYLLDRGALNVLITSSEFPNLLKWIHRCLHFGEADEDFFTDSGEADYSAADRCRINVQWYAAKVAQDILDSHIREAQENGKKKSRRGGNDQTP